MGFDDVNSVSQLLLFNEGSW